MWLSPANTDGIERDLHHDSSVEKCEGYQSKGEEREADTDDHHRSHYHRSGPDESREDTGEHLVDDVDVP